MLSNSFKIALPPCKGDAQPFGNCQALGIPDNLKLLIVVSDGAPSSFANNSVLNWAHITLPVLKAGMPVNMPKQFKTYQVHLGHKYWRSNSNHL